jgi:small conductance mechanosensitive channel
VNYNSGGSNLLFAAAYLTCDRSMILGQSVRPAHLKGHAESSGRRSMDGLLSSLSEFLDPEVLWPIVLDWSGRIFAAVLIFLIGRWVAVVLTSWFGKAVDRGGVEQTLKSFLSSLIYITLMVFVVLTAVGTLGVPTTNFLAIIGAAGLAIGLALKDSLSNFSSGVMLVFFRPFKVGDYVEAAGVGGTVSSIGIFNTVIKTPDNRVITVPNSLIYGDAITNFSAESTRRIDLVIGIGYDDDVQRAKALIQGVLSNEDRVLDDPAPTIMTLELGESSVNIAVRPWVKTSEYWPVRGELLERIKKALEDSGLSIPYPQRDLHIVSQAS